MISKLRHWLRGRKIQREVLTARQALDIFGISTEGMAESEVVRAAEDLNRRLSEGWQEIEESAYRSSTST